METPKANFKTLFKNLGWVTSVSTVSQILNILFLLLSSKLLSPEEYGLLAIILVIVSFSEILINAGFVPALIQKKEVSQEQFSSVFFLTFFISIVITIIICISSRTLAEFFKVPDIVNLIYFASISFLFIPFKIVPLVKATRKLDYKLISKISFASNILSLISGTLMLLCGMGIWGMVTKFVLYQVLNTLIFSLAIRWIPSLICNYKVVQDLVSFGVNQTLSDSLGYWSRKIDDILIGKFIGAHELGIYTFAYNFFVFPSQFLKAQIVTVAFPTFASIKDNGDELGNLYVQISGLLALIGFPMVLGLFSASDEIINGVIGAKWTEVIPIIKLFCIACIFEISIIPGALFQAIGRADLNLRTTLVTKSLNIIFIVIGINYGIEVVAQLLVASSIINFLIYCYTVQYFANISFARIVSSNFKPMLLALTMLAALEQIKSINITYFEINITHLLLAKVVTGVAIWLVGVALIKPDYLIHLRKLRKYVKPRS